MHGISSTYSEGGIDKVEEWGEGLAWADSCWSWAIKNGFYICVISIFCISESSHHIKNYKDII